MEDLLISKGGMMEDKVKQDDRQEMIDELLERFETELDDLDNGQLEALLNDYEGQPMLGGLLESLPDPDDEDDLEVVETDGLSYVDEEWADDE